MPTKVIMPQLGESVVEGTVASWLKQEGEQVNEFEPLLEVDTDKVNSEVPSPATGTVLKILVPESETVKAGTILAWIGEPGEEIPDGGAGAPQPRAEEQAPPSHNGHSGEQGKTQPVSVAAEDQQSSAPQAQGSAAGQPTPSSAPAPTPGRDRDLGFISPVVARLAQDENVDLREVPGTGEGGRITKKDVLNYVKERQAQPERPEIHTEPAAAAPWETPGEGDLFRPTELMFPQGRPGEKQAEKQPPKAPQPEAKPAQAAEGLPGDEVLPLTTVRRQIAEHMVRSKHTAPHVSTVMEANMQRVVQHREAHKDSYAREGANLTYTAYFVSAVVQALRAYPLVNSSWNDEGIHIHHEINVGVAVSLGEEGLIVPVIKQAGQYSLLGLAKTIADLAERARSHKLKPDDVRGGTFSITNHGISRSLFATPVINQPQAAILGVGMIQKRVVVIDDAIAIRPMVYLSLTFDHRILDGASADGFLGKIVDVLEGWG